MVTTRALSLTALALGTSLLASCRTDTPVAASNRTAAPEPAESGANDRDFTTVLNGRRQQAFFKINDNELNRVNYARLTAASAAAYGVPQTAIEFLNPLADVRSARRFSNMGEGAPLEVAAKAMHLRCTDQDLQPQACVDRITDTLRLVVFELNQPVPSSDPFAVYKNFMLGALDLTFGDVQHNGQNRLFTQPNCASCHSSKTAYQAADGSWRLVVDMRGTDQIADIKQTLDPNTLFSEGLASAESPDQRYLQIDPFVRAWGLMGAHYNRVRTTHAVRYHLLDADLREYANYASTKQARDGGWVQAFGSIALKQCSEEQAGVLAECGSRTFEVDPLTFNDQDFMLKSKTAALETFLPGGSREGITDALLSTSPLGIPVRSQRPFHYSSRMIFENGADAIFAYSYIKRIGLQSVSTSASYDDVLRNQKRYLAAATTISAPFPISVDSDLQVRFGIAYNEALNQLPALVLKDYAAAASLYHDMRQRPSGKWPSDLAVTMGKQSAIKAWDWVRGNCQGCHTSIVHDRPGFITGTLQEIDGAESGTQYPPAYKDSRTAYAQNVMSAISTKSALFAGFTHYRLNGDVYSQPSRTTFVHNRLLTPLGQTSWRRALDAMTGAPIAARYVAVLPRIDNNGMTQIAATAAYTNQGHEEIVNLTGIRPRVERSEHVQIMAPPSSVGIDNVARFLYGYSRGALRLYNETLPSDVTVVRFLPIKHCGGDMPVITGEVAEPCNGQGATSTGASTGGTTTGGSTGGTSTGGTSGGTVGGTTTSGSGSGSGTSSGGGGLSVPSIF